MANPYKHRSYKHPPYKHDAPANEYYEPNEPTSTKRQRVNSPAQTDAPNGNINRYDAINPAVQFMPDLSRSEKETLANSYKLRSYKHPPYEHEAPASER